MTDHLTDALLETADEIDFTGAVAVARPYHDVVRFARGHADRANARPNLVTTRFATASITKGFTALAVHHLVEAGAVTLDTTVASLLDGELPNVDERVTLRHLLSHRSGAGDYLDQPDADDVDHHLLGSRSAHEFDRPSAFLPELLVPPQRDEPDTVFRYNDSGFVILSLVIERLTGSFVDTVTDRVLAPAAMTRSGFFRSDDLPADTALGYLVDGRTNVFHLPVVGAGDGGAYVTVDDCLALWEALLSGRIVTPKTVAEMTVPGPTGNPDVGYGLGCWVSTDADHVWLEGMDAGVSGQTGFLRSSRVRYAVHANTSGGAWPMVRTLLTTLG